MLFIVSKYTVFYSCIVDNEYSLFCVCLVFKKKQHNFRIIMKNILKVFV